MKGPHTDHKSIRIKIFHLRSEELHESGQVVFILPTITFQVVLNDQVTGLADTPLLTGRKSKAKTPSSR